MVKKLLLRPAGMFSNVNEVIQQLYMAEQDKYLFVIDWSQSCYRDPARKIDPWCYYFEECFPDIEDVPSELELLPCGVPIVCSRKNIITPRLVNGNCSPLLLPKNRDLPHWLIQRYIHVKPHIQKIINSFAEEQLYGHMLGLHIRGPGRIDGGAPGLRSRFPGKRGVPFGQYFKFVDSYLLDHPGARIFASSDSAFVMREIEREYGGMVISYPSTRSEFGEMHDPRHPANMGVKYPAYKLGEDVLVEAYLLAKMDFFVHGNSNVVNFVLCANPSLEHEYVYKEG